MNVNFNIDFTINKNIITKALVFFISSNFILQMTNIIYIVTIGLFDGFDSGLLIKDPTKIIPIVLGWIIAIVFGIIFGKSGGRKNSRKENYTILVIVLMLEFLFIIIYLTYMNRIFVFKDNLLWNYEIPPDDIVLTESFYLKAHILEAIGAFRIFIQALVFYTFYFISFRFLVKPIK